MTGRDLVAAVERVSKGAGEFHVLFQPVVDLSRGVVAGYEALARFAGPPDAPPDRWFAAAHEAGLGPALEARVLSAALGARSRIPPDCFLAVNASADAVVSSEVGDVIGRAGDLRGVALEITEQTPTRDAERLDAALEPIRAAGATLAVDDVGGGFSSLKRILALRPGLVKVDRDLVSSIDRDEAKAAAIQMLGVFASRIDAWLLAEGVETLGELDRLLALGIPLAQGYRLGRPAPSMAAIDPLVAERCQRRSAQRRLGELLELAESAPQLASSPNDDAVADALRRNADARWIAVVDEFRRPIELIERGSGDAPPLRARPLRVHAGERLSEVVRRLVTRADRGPLAPVVVCDKRGRLIGVVPVERMLERLADDVDSAHRDGRVSAPGTSALVLGGLVRLPPRG